MNIFRSTYSYISLISAISAITIQTFVFQLLIDANLPSDRTFVINILTASGSYIAIYKALVKLYEQYGWRYILRKYRIEGTWYHEFVSKNGEPYIRHGRTDVIQSPLSVTFSGRNYDMDLTRSSRTIWRSISFEINENGWIIFAYQAHRGNRGAPDGIITKEGVMYVQIKLDERGVPCCMIGEFADSVPAKNRGSVTWVREPPSWASTLDSKEELLEPEDLVETEPTSSEGKTQ